MKNRALRPAQRKNRKSSKIWYAIAAAISLPSLTVTAYAGDLDSTLDSAAHGIEPVTSVMRCHSLESGKQFEVAFDSADSQQELNWNVLAIRNLKPEVKIGLSQIDFNALPFASSPMSGYSYRVQNSNAYPSLALAAQLIGNTLPSQSYSLSAFADGVQNNKLGVVGRYSFNQDWYNINLQYGVSAWDFLSERGVQFGARSQTKNWHVEAGYTFKTKYQNEMFECVYLNVSRSLNQKSHIGGRSSSWSLNSNYEYRQANSRSAFDSQKFSISLDWLNRNTQVSIGARAENQFEGQWKLAHGGIEISKFF